MAELITPETPKCPFMAQLVPARGPLVAGMSNGVQLLAPDCMKAGCGLWVGVPNSKTGHCGLIAQVSII